jgi:hypothetical protein
MFSSAQMLNLKPEFGPVQVIETEPLLYTVQYGNGSVKFSSVNLISGSVL